MQLGELLKRIANVPQRASVQLTAEQRQILEAGEGPLWVIAGPGSGKTETLVLRCLRLLYVDFVQPRAILLTTFTEKAAHEIEDRLAVYAAAIADGATGPEKDVDVTQVRVGTLHALCNDIMLEYRYPPYQNVRLMDGLEQLIFINEHSSVVNHRQLSEAETRLWTVFGGLLGGFGPVASRIRVSAFRARCLRDLVNRIAEYRIDVDRLRAAGDYWAVLAAAYDDYREKLLNMNRSDFSHVQVTFLRFLGDPKGVLFGAGDDTVDHPGVEHILVDEYQDTNPVQESIYLALASGKPHNLMVVGDDDQAIYRFRGGTVESLISFNDSCARVWGVPAESIQPLPLYDNFRSHSRVVDWCNRYITSFPAMRQAGARAPGKRDLVARARLNTEAGDYPSVNILTGPRVQDCARVFAATVRQLLDRHIINDPRSCALLLTSTRETRPWAMHYAAELRRQGIEPYNPRSKRFLQQTEVQAALGAMLAILDPGLVACPQNAAVRRSAQNWATTFAVESAGLADLDQYIRDSIAQIVSTGPGTLLRTTVMELFYILISFAPFTTWQADPERTARLAKLTRILETYTSMPPPDSPLRTRNLLATSAQGGEISRRWLNAFYWGLVGILEQEGLDDEEDEFDPFPAGRLPFLTIHQAKGLQFPFVFVAMSDNQPVGPSPAHEAEDLLQPYRMFQPSAQSPAGVRAEQDLARLFYVAHSRAQYALTILVTHTQRDMLACPTLGPGGMNWLLSNGGSDITLLPV